MHDPVNEQYSDQCESDQLQVVCPAVVVYSHLGGRFLHRFLDQSLAAADCALVAA